MATGDKKRAVMTTDIDNGNSSYPVLSPSGDGSDVTAAFTAASTRTNISTGEKLGVIFGKIAKWFTDLGAAAFRGVDAAPTAGSTALVESGGVKSAITHDLANIVATGTTNTTGAAIAAGTYFYLNGTLVRAKANIAVNATFTSGTNYEEVAAGGLNDLTVAFDDRLVGIRQMTILCPAGASVYLNRPDSANSSFQVLLSVFTIEPTGMGLYFISGYADLSGNDLVSPIISAADWSVTKSASRFTIKNNATNEPGRVIATVLLEGNRPLSLTNS